MDSLFSNTKKKKKDGQYSDSAATLCKICPPNSVSTADRTTCDCNIEYYGVLQEGQNLILFFHICFVDNYV